MRNIKSSGARIDGVGLQAHFIVGQTPSKATLKQVLAMFSAEVDARTAADPRVAALAEKVAAASAGERAELATELASRIDAMTFDDEDDDGGG